MIYDINDVQSLAFEKAIDRPAKKLLPIVQDINDKLLGILDLYSESKLKEGKNESLLTTKTCLSPFN